MPKLTNRQIDVALCEEPMVEDFDDFEYPFDEQWDDFEDYQNSLDPEPDWYYDPYPLFDEVIYA